MACRLAIAAKEDLVIMVAEHPGDDAAEKAGVSAKNRAQAIGQPQARIRTNTIHGVRIDDTLHALVGVRERLIVMSRTAPPAAEASRIAAARGVPVLLVDGMDVQPAWRWTHAVMSRAEQQGLAYLFRLRLTANLKRTRTKMMAERDWTNAGHGWQGEAAMLWLVGWSRQRRVVLLRLVAEQKTAGFKDTAISRDQAGDGDHGRIETRTTTVIHDVAWLRERHDWPGLKAVVMVESTRETTGKIQQETRFYRFAGADMRRISLDRGVTMSLAMRQEHAKQFPHGRTSAREARAIHAWLRSPTAVAVDPETMPPCEAVPIDCAAPDDRLYQGLATRGGELDDEAGDEPNGAVKAVHEILQAEEQEETPLNSDPPAAS